MQEYFDKFFRGNLTYSVALLFWGTINLYFYAINL